MGMFWQRPGKAIGQDPVNAQRECANELTAAHVVACRTPLPLYPNTVSTSMRRRKPQPEGRTTVRPPEQVALKACDGRVRGACCGSFEPTHRLRVPHRV